MRVFSVEMLVKEEGAATVQAALNRLKKETQAVAADMKTTSQAVTNTGKAMQGAAAQTQIAGDRAAKAAIGFAAVGQSIARTGSLTADVGTKIIESGSQIASMFGPGGLIVGAILAAGVAIVSGMSKARDEIEKTKKSFDEFADVGNVKAIQEQLNRLVQGRPSQNFRDGIIGLSTELVKLKQQYKGVVAGLDELTASSAFQLRMNEDLTNQEKRDLIRIGELNSLLREKNELVARLQVLLPIATSVEAANAAAIKNTTESVKAFKAEVTRPATPLRAMPQQATAGTTAVQALAFDISTIQAAIPQATSIILTDAQKAAVDLANNIQQTFQQNVGGALVAGISMGIEQAVASGSIGEGFKALGSMLLAGLGDAMIRFGTTTAAFAQFMAAIMESLSSLMPGGALAASIAMIAFGSALKGVARGMFGGQGGGAAVSIGSFGGGGGGFGGGMGGAMPTTQLIFGQTSATTAAGMTPRSSMNVTVIGPNDPSAQRAIQELMTKANSRGRVG